MACRVTQLLQRLMPDLANTLLTISRLTNGIVILADTILFVLSTFGILLARWDICGVNAGEKAGDCQALGSGFTVPREARSVLGWISTSYIPSIHSIDSKRLFVLKCLIITGNHCTIWCSHGFEVNPLSGPSPCVQEVATYYSVTIRYNIQPSHTCIRQRLTSHSGSSRRSGIAAKFPRCHWQPKQWLAGHHCRAVSDRLSRGLRCGRHFRQQVGPENDDIHWHRHHDLRRCHSGFYSWFRTAHCWTIDQRRW